MSKFDPQPGDVIQFLHTLDCDADEESPGCTFARKGDLGHIDRVGGCREGFWVFWERWSRASFGCERKDFLILDPEDRMTQLELPLQDSEKSSEQGLE